MSYAASTHHSFSVELATEYGIEEAILIHHFQHWIKINRRKNKNFKDGHWWTYQTREEIAAHFPYWSSENIRRYIESLEKKGIIKTGNFNKINFDKTLWYAFADEEKFLGPQENSNNSYERQICQIEVANLPNRTGKSATPIPDTKTNTKETTTDPLPPKGAAAGLSVEEQLKRSKFSEVQALEAVEFYKSNKQEADEKKNPIGWIITMVELGKHKEIAAANEKAEKRKDWAQKNEYSCGSGYMMAVKDGVVKVSGGVEKLIKYSSNDPFWEQVGLSFA